MWLWVFFLGVSQTRLLAWVLSPQATQIKRVQFTELHPFFRSSLDPRAQDSWPFGPGHWGKVRTEPQDALPGQPRKGKGLDLLSWTTQRIRVQEAHFRKR